MTTIGDMAKRGIEGVHFPEDAPKLIWKGSNQTSQIWQLHIKYMARHTNLESWKWSGSAYIEVTSTLKETRTPTRPNVFAVAPKGTYEMNVEHLAI